MRFLLCVYRFRDVYPAPSHAAAGELWPVDPTWSVLSPVRACEASTSLGGVGGSALRSRQRTDQRHLRGGQPGLHSPQLTGYSEQVPTSFTVCARRQPSAVYLSA